MKYKVLYKVLFAVALVFLLSACISENIPRDGGQDIPEGMVAIDFSVKVMNQQTANPLRSTTTGQALRALPTEEGNKYNNDLNENNIDNVDVFLFKTDGTLQRRVSSTSGLQKTGDELATNLRILIPYRDISQYEGNSFKIVVVANATATIPVINTLDDLKLVIQETSDINKSGAVQKKFLMDGEIDSKVITWGGKLVYTVPGALPLRRAASKIRLRISDINVSVTENGSTVKYEMVGDPQVKLVHYIEKTSLLQNTPYSVTASDWKSAVYRPMVTKVYPDKINDLKRDTPEKNNFLSADVPFYAYENNWKDAAENETYLMVKLSLRAKDQSGVYGASKDYFYRIPVNYRMPVPGMSEEAKASLYQLQRNYLYDIVSAIGILGSEDEGEPIDVAAYVAIQPWNEPDVIDGSIRNAHYLVVKELRPLMPNMDTRNVGYISDLPIKIDITKTSYTYYDVEGNKVVYVDNGTNVTITTTPWNGGNATTKTYQYDDPDPQTGKVITRFDETTVDFDQSDPLNKKLVIKHDIPTNYVPFEIDFTVTHVMPQGESGTPLSQRVHVTQYPPKYVTGDRSPGYAGGTSDVAGADFRFHDMLGARATNPVTGKLASQTNNVFYKVTTVVNAGTERIGDPVDANGRTKSDATSNQLISPEFIIATQHGMSLPVPQRRGRSNVGWQQIDFGARFGPYSSRFEDRDPYYDPNETSYDRNNVYQSNMNAYKDAEDRCFYYFEGEYGMDGTYTEYYEYLDQHKRIRNRQRLVTKTFKYKGRWRLPTSAEVKYIDAIQDAEGSAVKSLLWGQFYWSAETKRAFNFNKNDWRNGSEDAYVRCVFDTYKVVNH